MVIDEALLTEKGATIVEVAIVCALVMLVCFSAVARVGYGSAKKFCRPVQALQFGEGVYKWGLRAKEIGDEFRCEDRFGDNVEGWILNRPF